jgi:16S rRNA (cytosine967-C5)-methyltransferase
VSVSPARQLAYRVLLQVEQGSGFAEDLLHSLAGPALKDADHRLATEIVMGTLRLRGDLDEALAKLSAKVCSFFDVQVLTALRLGAYQIRWLRKIPKSAAVNESVELTKQARKRSAAGLVNAILRKCEPAPVRPGDPAWNSRNPQATSCALRSLPDWLRERWKTNFGDAEATALAWTAIHSPSMSLCVFGETKKAERALRELQEAGISARVGRFARNAIVAEPSQHLSSLRLFKEGRAVIQDEASQLVASLLGARADERVLDLCAAPGLKSSHIANAMRTGFIAACDRSGQRLRAMKGLWPRWNQSKVSWLLVQLDAAAELPFRGQFKRILLDAPCSGSGTLARNPEIKWRLQPQDLGRFAARQRQMLGNALGLVARGGRLVYATCSLEPEENEEVVEDVLKSFLGFRTLRRAELLGEFPSLDPLIGPSGYFQARPDLHGTDGFFAAAITRET